MTPTPVVINWQTDPTLLHNFWTVIFPNAIWGYAAQFLVWWTIPIVTILAIVLVGFVVNNIKRSL